MIRVLKNRDHHLIIPIFNFRLRSNDIILILLKIVLCHYRNDSKPDIPKQILLISKQEISSGNRIYFFTTKPVKPAKPMKRQLCLTTTEKISDLVFTSPKR